MTMEQPLFFLPGRSHFTCLRLFSFFRHNIGLNCLFQFTGISTASTKKITFAL